MVAYTGSLKDFGLVSLMPYSPTLLFVPSGPAFSTIGQVLTSRPIPAVLDSSGNFSVDLVPNETLQPDTWYTLKATWLDAAGNFVSVDFPDWQLRAKISGGSISDLPGLPSNPAQTWVGVTPPPTPATPGTWWLNPSTGDLFEWSN